MCLAVPVCVVEHLAEGMVKARVGESESFMTLSTLLLAEPPKVGDYVIVHAGFALRVLEPEEARESLAYFRQIADMEGKAVDF